MKRLRSIPIVLFTFFALVDCHAASRECRDKFHNCDSWRRSGFCAANSHTFYLRSGCARSCGYCTIEGPVPSIPVFEPAQDIHEPRQKLGKPSLVAVGKATLNGKGTRADASRNNKLRVPPTAEEGAPFEEKPECEDRFVSKTCKKWKDLDICMDERYRKFFTYGCAYTCRFCNCRDTLREKPYCKEWKKRGFCDLYKEQLDTYCPLTCGFCIRAEYKEENTTKPSPTQNATAQPASAQNATNPAVAQNITGQAASNGSTHDYLKLAVDIPKPITGIAKPIASFAKPLLGIVKPLPGITKPRDLATKIIRGNPIPFVDNGNTNAKRGFAFAEGGSSPLWSVNANTRLTLPQPEQYDEMGGAVSRPLEDGTYFTPAKTNDKFDYYTEHYSPDPYVAAAQREEWMSSNRGITGGPSLSRKSKKPDVKPSEKESSKALKKASIRHKHGKHSRSGLQE